MTSGATALRLSASIGRLRLATGLILFTYVVLHLANHAAGVVSLAAMEAFGALMYALVHAPPVAWALYGALAIHFLLALHAIHRRRQLWSMPRAEALQLALGLSIVPLLAGHVVGTRLAGEAFAVAYTHTHVFIELGWVVPFGSLRQGLALVVAWVHGCVGMFFWLRLKPSWPSLRPWLQPAALLLPALAMCGAMAGSREVEIRAEADGWIASQREALNAPGMAARATLARWTDLILVLWGAGIATALATRQLRLWREGRRGIVRLSYPQGRVVEIPRGLSVLEASHLAGVPHASICGGRGRCSTCRIRVGAGAENLPPPSPAESAVLARVGSPMPMRLACQLRPISDLALAPLLPARPPVREARRRITDATTLGQEREIAVLFADLRGFTQLAEHKLPFDVVFVLNRYFEAMGRAIEAAGGQVDKFIGDGVMALFGTRSGSTDTVEDAGRLAAASAAFDAARRMSLALKDLNASLAHDLQSPLRMGIGIHVGPVILGEMGYGHATGLTAIGDTVNLASRIEALCKSFGAELVASADAATAGGIDPAGWRRERAPIIGRDGGIDVVVISRADLLPAPATRAAV
jgi:adenylate cyclase